MADRRSTVSLFSGAMGLDLGLEAAGFQIRAAVEMNPIAVETIRSNRDDLVVFDRAVQDVTSAELLEAAGKAVGELELVCAGPSCQAYSTAGKRLSMEDSRGTLFRNFLNVVRDTKPRFFLMENVRGLLSAAERHRPLAKRGPGYPPLDPEECYGSAFSTMLSELRATGYSIFFDVLNAADYGSPQRRERLFIVGSRDGQRFDFPKPTHSQLGGNGTSKWRTLRQALHGLQDPDPLYFEFSPSKAAIVPLIPEGGNWRDLPEEMWEQALGGAAKSWGGRTGFFRRLSWDGPTPALTTRPDSKATMFCHPDQDRPLSVREYARIQQFPDDWSIAGVITQQYTQIGNAVPVGLAQAVGGAIRRAGNRKVNRCEPGVVYCGNEDLIRRMRNARGTVLNPERMGIERALGQTREWMRGSHDQRVATVDSIELLP